MDTSLTHYPTDSLTSDAERRFLNRLFWGAFAVRAVIGLAIFVLDLQMFNGDNVHYEYMGWRLSEIWTSDTPQTQIRLHGAGDFNIGMYLWVAVIYFLIGGRWVLVPLAVNWVVGAVNALLVYHIAKHLFNQEVARRASLFVAFLPSFAFWSALLYKEAVVFFFIALSLYALLQLQRQLSGRYAVIIVVSLLGLQTFRAYLSYLMGVSIMLGLLVGSRRRGGLSRMQRIALLGVILAFAVAAGGLERAKSHFSMDIFQQVLISRADLAQSASSGYLADVDITSPRAALAYLPKGLAYLLFAPAPWQLGSPRQTLAIPETLLWYALIPFTLIGMVYAWRHRRGESIPIFAFTFGLVFFYAFFIGNIGTAVRERTQFIALWLIFASAGLILKRRGQIK